ncbi:RNA polymerase subunit sigma-70 [Spiribacter halobius]|uniref:RNA polymerase subunit sigma-70 n=1 Tax=Sediminicurvatus halobius TaxID=2182432 RepID=A0A2U2MYR6_9GAMM|nr:RNA polymerase subunit sigma-70 [Spiribacter halobius]UEX78719.1 RNA polymerase sigma factor [Spiribacter halobius]
MNATGQEALQEQLVALLPRLRRFACALTGSVDEGDDLLQAACERALSRAERWQPGTRLDHWMMALTRNLWIDGLRSRRRRAEVAYDPDSDDRGFDGSAALEASATLERVRALVAQLPPEQREVVALVTISGLSYREAGEQIGVPTGTVMSRLARARARLAEAIADPGA